MRVLAWLGHRAITALAAGAIAGLLLPQFAGYLRRILPELIFLFTALSFLTADWSSIVPPRGHRSLPCALIIWCNIVVPLIVGLALLVPILPNGLSQAIVLWTLSPPMTAAIIFAMILRLETSLTISVTTISIVIAPILGPTLYLCLAGSALKFDGLLIAGHICIFTITAMLVSYLSFRFVGSRRISRYAPQLKGCVVLILVAYSNALTSGISEEFSRTPWRVVAFLAAAFSMNVFVQAFTLCVFPRLDIKTRMTCALLAGNRNMSILCASFGPASTPDVMVFFAVSHIPTYTMPWLFRGLYRRSLEKMAVKTNIQATNTF